MIEPSEISPESAIAAIEESMALPGKVCRVLGCTLKEFNDLKESNDDVKAAWDLKKEETRDGIEERIINLALQGNPQMIKLYAETQMADRGYSGDKSSEVKTPVVNITLQKAEDV